MKMFSFFWKWFHRRYANEKVSKISIPTEIIGRFDYHYFIYDENGMVVDGAANMLSAIKKAKQKNLYITRVWD